MKQLLCICIKWDKSCCDNLVIFYSERRKIMFKNRITGSFFKVHVEETLSETHNLTQHLPNTHKHTICPIHPRLWNRQQREEHQRDNTIGKA